MRSRTVTVCQFSQAAVANLLASSGVAVRYLGGYLDALNARSILVENHYVDRHYLDEFSHYYSKSFVPPAASCARLHFFDGLGDAELSNILTTAYSGKAGRTSAEVELQKRYLGFVVRRPLSAATIGRTVLKTYPVENRRHYSAIRPYTVNVAGLRLVVEGLAYQQQDRGAAVCASTALWSALQRVAYIEGNRTPTPSAITRAARSPYPANVGLGSDQMASALDTLGYIAEGLVPVDNRPLFRAEIGSYLDSRLAVILLIATKRKTGAGGEVSLRHAITVTGYSENATIADVIPHLRDGAPPIRMKVGALDTIYVHDDNIGSHVHYELFDSDAEDEQGYKKLMLRRGRSNAQPADCWPTDEWHVQGALVPKPSKLRLPMAGLFDALLWLRGALEQIVFPGVALHFGVRFESGVSYARAVMDLNIDFDQLRSFLSTVSLPRHIGIVSAHTGETHLCDMIIDVSEIDRNPHKPSVLGIVAPGVPFMSEIFVNMMEFQGVLACPLLPAPPTELDGSTDVTASSSEVSASADPALADDAKPPL